MVAAATAARIGTMIRRDALAPGTRLPGERELARRLGVSRNSVREALRSLQAAGVVRTRHGSGTVVAGGEDGTAAGAELLRTPLEALLLRLGRAGVEEFCEVRELIEGRLAARAAERRTDADLVALEAALGAIRVAAGDPRARAAADVAFHEALAAAARMPLLGALTAGLRDGIRASIETTSPGYSDWGATADVHAEILDAVRRRSATDAARAMSLHMAMTARELRRQGVLGAAADAVPADEERTEP